jgi:hypothetical protein
MEFILQMVTANLQNHAVSAFPLQPALLPGGFRKIKKSGLLSRTGTTDALSAVVS